MYIKWDDESTDRVHKAEAEKKLSAIVADQLIRLRKEIKKRGLVHQDQVLSFISSEVNRVLGVPVADQDRPTEGWVISLVAKASAALPERFMFMVDRSRVRHSWWSDDLEDALVYYTHEQAEVRMMTLKHGEPKIITYAEAMELSAANDKTYLATAVQED